MLMSKSRLEAFSDGVVAIIITIMVLEMRVPVGASIWNLEPLLSVMLSYILSYGFMGIYWSNHHHLLHTLHHVNGKILWANLHLLFWLSLIPFVTKWLGDQGLQPWPVALYGVVMFCCAAAYFLLVRMIICHQGKESALKKALGEDIKGKLSVLIYAVSIPMAFVFPEVSCVGYIMVALMWAVPDKRIEEMLE